MFCVDDVKAGGIFVVLYMHIDALGHVVIVGGSGMDDVCMYCMYSIIEITGIPGLSTTARNLPCPCTV
jgi:hypothetical protein